VPLAPERGQIIRDQPIAVGEEPDGGGGLRRFTQLVNQHPHEHIGVDGYQLPARARMTRSMVRLGWSVVEVRLPDALKSC